MSVVTDESKPSDVSELNAVSGGKVWKPKQFSSQISLGGIVMLVFLAIPYVTLAVSYFTNQTPTLDQIPTMTESLWLEEGSNRPLLRLYIISFVLWMLVCTCMLLLPTSQLFRRILCGVVLPISIVSLFLTTTQEFSKSDDTLAQQWAEQKYGYTLLDEPRRGDTSINVKDSAGVEKNVHVAILNDVVYLTEDAGKVYKLLIDEQEQSLEEIEPPNKTKGMEKER